MTRKTNHAGLLPPLLKKIKWREADRYKNKEKERKKEGEGHDNHQSAAEKGEEEGEEEKRGREDGAARGGAREKSTVCAGILGAFGHSAAPSGVIPPDLL